MLDKQDRERAVNGVSGGIARSKSEIKSSGEVLLRRHLGKYLKEGKEETWIRGKRRVGRGTRPGRISHRPYGYVGLGAYSLITQD